ncbi:hemolysin XhlA [Pantoea sp. MBD-2R]|uniref:hemolysin XhlA n=1 Tax=unclassified Pantoea TaxID=2630326 RepID=UPI0011BE00DB|nr:hemolysin XhlA [Pantoea sp. CCBC3-3-1]
MIERMKLLESKVETLLIDVAVIKADYATRVDIESVRREIRSSITAQTKWFIAALFLLPGLGLGIAKLLF